jgi:hypothetical protein
MSVIVGSGLLSDFVYSIHSFISMCLALTFLIRGSCAATHARGMGKTIRHSFFIRKSLEDLKFFAFFFGEKNGLQKISGNVLCFSRT